MIMSSTFLKKSSIIFITMIMSITLILLINVMIHSLKELIYIESIVTFIKLDEGYFICYQKLSIAKVNRHYHTKQESKIGLNALEISIVNHYQANNLSNQY